MALLDGHMAQHVINWKNLAPSSKVRSLQLCDFSSFSLIQKEYLLLLIWPRRVQMNQMLKEPLSHSLDLAFTPMGSYRRLKVCWLFVWNYILLTKND